MNSSSLFRNSLSILFAMALILALACTAQAQKPASPVPVQPASMKTPQQQTAVEGAKRSPVEEAMLRGNVKMVRREYTDAIRSFNEVLRKEPKNAYALNQIGIAYYNLNDLGMAKRYYDRSIKADATLANAHNNVGVVHYRQKKFSRAINAYLKALALYQKAGDESPGQAAVYSNLGYAYFGAKKYEEALVSFQTAMALDPIVLERRSASGGNLLQERTVEERAYFFFFIAKSYALAKNPERVAHYLKRAFEEGYKDVLSVKKDAAFAGVVEDPQVKEVLEMVAAAPPRKT
jgi:tetratricopeptide (TPR) repeat protein